MEVPPSPAPHGRTLLPAQTVAGEQHLQGLSETRLPGAVAADDQREAGSRPQRITTINGSLTATRRVSRPRRGCNLGPVRAYGRRELEMDFSELYRRYARDVHRFALFLSGNRVVAEDLTSETFVRAFVGRDDLRVETVKAYLFAIARNLYHDLRRRESRLVSLGEATPGVDPGRGPQSTPDGRLRLEEVLAAVQRLPDGEREALVLAVDHELPYAEIGRILGCSVSAVKVRVHRARARLKGMVEKEGTCRT